jgi:hypothetical protein
VALKQLSLIEQRNSGIIGIYSYQWRTTKRSVVWR